jgi:hypothetical protein
MDRFIGGHIFGADAQPVIDIARHQKTFAHFRALTHRVFKPHQIILGLAVQRDLYHDIDRLIAVASCPVMIV